MAKKYITTKKILKHIVKDIAHYNIIISHFYSLLSTINF